MEDINPEELFGNPEELFRSKRCRTITITNFLLEQMKLLMELNLSGCNITDQGAETLATILLETASLEILDLSETMLNTIKVIKISNSLKSLSCLKTLNINKNDIDDDATESIAAVICNNCLLEKLNISYNQFSYTGVLNIAKSLLVTKNIRVFDISNNSIKSDCAIELAAALSKCPMLQEINISRSSLSLTNVLTIAQFFRYHPTLQILDISDNIASFPSACECIMDIVLSVNQTIVSLDVCGRNIRPRYIEDYLSPQNSVNITTEFTLQSLNLMQHSLLGFDIDNARTKLIKATEPCPILSDDIISYYVDSVGAAFYNPYHNFVILIPPGAVSQGECVEIQATANYFGPFKIPDGLYPISSYFWFSANYEFKTPVYLIMNHYARIRSLEDVINLHVLHACTHDSNVMNEMSAISDGVYFDYNIGFCVLATKHFCSYCQAKGIKHIPESLLACYCTYDDPVRESLIAEVSFCPSNSHCKKVTTYCYILIGASLSEPHQMLQRFQINAFQHRRTDRPSLQCKRYGKWNLSVYYVQCMHFALPVYH